MANPILHIKDSYYFEVPKFMWRYDYKSLADMPASMDFLKTGHPHATVEDFNRELSGKILIPQPPGVVLKNLYEKESGFAISRFMVMELVVAILMILIFTRLASRMKHGDPPQGRLWNLFESMLLFVRDEVARPAIDSHDHHDEHADDHGGHSHGHGHSAKHELPKHDGDRFVPLLWTLFFFVLMSNLFGLVPWTGSPTASFAVTLGLATVALLTVVLSGTKTFGLVGFWLNQVPSMDLPWYMSPLKLVIWVIEVAGLLIRHGILAVRLLANMVAGHLVLLSIMGLAFSIEGAASPSWKIAAPISVIASVLLSCLELFVAFLQAYIFTFLTALFIGAANHRH